MKKFLLLLILCVQPIFSQDSIYTQSFISLQNTGVREFLNKYPEYDGRGTIIYIIDSGVDAGVEGLQQTTTGETKIIDLQDFSGEGNTRFYKAETDEINDTLYFVNEDEKLKVAGVESITLKPIDGKYHIGSLDEQKWLNSGARTMDLNGNGKTDDRFVYVTFKINQDDWVLYIDTNSDGSLEDEVPVKNYKLEFDTFQIENELDLPAYTFAVNIFPGNNEVIFHYDAVAHGTHCAGIAAGYEIGNNNLNGVAPGAYLGSLKIGNSTVGAISVTGSMKAAYDYADKVARERKEPVIVNMSYGIGSEIEGNAEMEKYLSQLVSANPYLYIATSNGNEGPGISTTGLPAASDKIFSTGAVLAQEVGNDLYGTVLNSDIILHFSSRGGEVNKPDVVAPGAAASTVPYWTNYDRMWGTSMASPYSAGVMSLLLSAMKSEYPDIQIPSLLLYKVLKESAQPLEGYNRLDQGVGMINVVKAYDLLKKYIDNGELDKFEIYSVSSFAPNTPSGEASSFYLRNGSYLSGTETFSFNIKRDDFIGKEKFYRTYKIESDKDWLVPITKRVHIRNKQTASVNFKFNDEMMKQPGLYTGLLKASRADRTNFPEFEMPVTVVIPYEFNYENNYMKTFIGKLAPAEVKRYFLNIPAGSSSMKVKLYRDKQDYTKAWYSLHDQQGRTVESSGLLDSDENEFEEFDFYYDLLPGVYELDVVGYYKATDSVDYKLDLEFFSIESVGSNTVGKNKRYVNVINRFNRVERFDLSAELTGYENDYFIEIKDSSLYEMPFIMNADEKEKIFNLSLSKEDYNKTTDFETQIIDTSGKVISSSSFGYKDNEISIYNSYDAEELKFTLKLVPAFVKSDEEITVHITEETILKERIEIQGRNKGNSEVILYPSIKETIDLDYDFSGINFPEQTIPRGIIYFSNPENKNTIYELPIYFNLEEGVIE